MNTLRDTIESVLNQDYSNIEYIIVDGRSTDGTVELVQSYGKRIHKFISEEDNGLYDAINKGISVASGDVIGLLHSDDLFYKSSAVSQIVQAFDSNTVDSVYSDMHYVDKTDTWKVIRDWKSGTYERSRFRRGWMPPHPTFYVRRSVYETYGLYDTDFRSAADYELMLRYLYKYGISTYYIQDTLIKMRVGGASNYSFMHRIKANREDYIAWKKNNLSPRFYTRFMKPLRKISQYTAIRKLGFFRT
ncbi:glycosyl transferase family protein [Flammeovirgaceae bacterium 311]|nr:glycosyl transferase family protein [Flammeovirgaceae bacterium 311]